MSNKAETHKEIDTLCWKCRNAVPTQKNGCTWSIAGKPVEGWTAIRSVEREESIKRDACYTVINCPMFAPDNGKEQMDGTNNAFKGLGLAVVTQCVVDYRDCLRKMRDDGDFYKLCMMRRKQYVKIRNWIYARKQVASRKGNTKMFDFLNDKKVKLRKRFQPYRLYAERGYRTEQMLKSCEWFFHTEEFLDYSDMDGVRIMHMIQEEVEAEGKGNDGGEREV